MNNTLNQHLRYSTSDNIAQERYDKYKGKDPFPFIAPALLNSADIADYVASVGMIYPFDPARLGPASYEMVVGGEYLCWDEEEKKFSSTEVKEGEPVVLRKNSITYVSVRQTFRIPDYIALRFNLRVRHVHRGLLLGTGPLIDPGFHGKIMVPIHNLTSNEYEILGGEDLISVEFTKVSRNDAWKIPKDERLKPVGEYKANSGKNSKNTFADLLRKALPIGVGKVVSSLSGTLALANKRIEEAYRQIKAANLQIKDNKAKFSEYRNISIGAAGALFIALIVLFLTTYSVVSDANKYVSDSSMLIKKNEKADVDLRNFVVRDEVDVLQSKVEQLVHAVGPGGENEKIIDGLRNVAKQSEVDELKKQIKDLNNKLENLINSKPKAVNNNESR